MCQKPSLRRHPGWRLHLVAITLVLGGTLVACSQETDQPPPEKQDSMAALDAPSSTRVTGMDLQQLRDSASRAMAEQRLYAPAGDNAMEYYLALRDKAPNDATVTSALTDLMPYALIAVEQDITRRDATEAQRMFALMERVDPQAPALPRLRDAITDMQAALVATEPAPAEPVAQRPQPQPDNPVAPRTNPAPALPPRPVPAPAPAPASATGNQPPPAESSSAATAAPPARPSRQAAQSAAREAPAPESDDTPPPAPAAASASRRTRDDAGANTTDAAPTLRALRTQAPVYPPEALSSGLSGEVVVEFIVNTDGGVRNARVVRATPPRIFNQATLAAVRRWRFAPIKAPVQIRRTIAYSPGNP